MFDTTEIRKLHDGVKKEKNDAVNKIIDNYKNLGIDSVYIPNNLYNKKCLIYPLLGIGFSLINIILMPLLVKISEGFLLMLFLDFTLFPVSVCFIEQDWEFIKKNNRYSTNNFFNKIQMDDGKKDYIFEYAYNNPLDLEIAFQKELLKIENNLINQASPELIMSLNSEEK